MTMQQEAKEVAQKFGVTVKAVQKNQHLVNVSFERRDVEYGTDIPFDGFSDGLASWLKGLGLESK